MTETLEHSRLFVPPQGIILPGHGLLIDVPEPMSAKEFNRIFEEFGVPPIAGGAWTVSGLYLLNWIDLLDATQLAIDTSLATHKWALYTNTETPNYSTEVGYAVTNEVAGTGYTAGGQVIVSPTTTESPAGTLMYDMADQVWASPTTITARGGKLYADVLVGNNLIVAQNYGADIISTASTFTVQFAAAGVATIDLTP